MFNFIDARSPWDRRSNYGFRCVELRSVPSPAATAKLELPVRDVWKDRIASDESFAAYKGLYAYDRTELKARLEDTQTTGNWTHETFSFNPAYGSERVLAHLFLPNHVPPPFQTVVYFPGASAILLDRFDDGSQKLIPAPGDAQGTVVARQTNLDFLLKNGRAVLFPIYKGTFERHDDIQPGGPITNAPALWRDHMIAWSKDVGRSLDYLATRKDIDSTRLAYFGFSWGGAVAPVVLAVEGRFKAAVLSSGGTWFQRALPEADGVNFASRVRVPVLMLSGRYDDFYPVESDQLPIFRRLGTPDKDRKHVIYDAGHGAVPRTEEVRETLDWLDKYLGPVRS
jgi:dienelactone hydrolase